MRLLLGLFIALAASAAAAQSLREAVDAAWSRHPQARLLDGRVAEAQARRQVADALFAGPGEMTIASREDRLYNNLGQREYEAEIAMPLWLPGQRGAQQRLAQQEQAEIDAQRQALRLSLAGEVREAWLAADLARSGSALARQRLETSRKLETDVKRRLRVGDVSRFDANLAEAERLAAEGELVEAQAKEFEAAVALRALTGLDISAELPAPPATDTPDTPGAGVAAARHAAEVAAARLRSAQATTREPPEVALGMRRERADFNEAYANSLVVRLRLPFASTPRNEERIAAARAEMDQADATLRQAEIRTSLERERARREVHNAQRSREFTDSRLRLAQDNQTLARKAYALGEIDLVSLLRSEAAALEAERAGEKARLLLNAAHGRLNQAFGIVP